MISFLNTYTNLIFHELFSMLSFFLTRFLKEPVLHTQKFTKSQKIYNSIVLRNKLQNEGYEGFVSSLLGKSLESNVVSVKVCKQRVVHIGNIVFHTAFTSL